MLRNARFVFAALSIAGGSIIAGAPALAQTQNTGYDWTGPYVGVHAGYAWGEEHDNLSDTFEIPEESGDSFDIEGVIGGVHAGYDWQHGVLILGAEAMFDGSG